MKRTTCHFDFHPGITCEKILIVLQFSAHEALYMVTNVGQINMTKSNNEAFSLHKIYHVSIGLIIL